MTPVGTSCVTDALIAEVVQDVHDVVYAFDMVRERRSDIPDALLRPQRAEALVVGSDAAVHESPDERADRVLVDDPLQVGFAVWHGDLLCDGSGRAQARPSCLRRHRESVCAPMAEL
jgi:hypothetical protein